MFRVSKTGSKLARLVKPHASLVFLLTVAKRFFCYGCLCVCGLFSHYLFLISPSFGASGRLCFVIVTFTRYLHFYI